MLFKRRDKRDVLLLLRNLIWPYKGWRRGIDYIGQRIRRFKVPPKKIAIGFAWGAAFGFTPLLGLHFLLAPFFSWLTGGHIMSALLGTLVCNPITIPFIFLLIYSVGIYFLGYQGAVIEDSVGPQYLLDNFMTIFMPMLIGSIPVALLIWIFTFFVTKRTMEMYYKKNKRTQKNTPV